MGGPDQAPEMTLDDVCAFLVRMDELRVRVWLDGGWAVDAQLGRQTRPHADLDLVVEQRHVETIVDALMANSYGPVARDDTRAWNFVLGDRRGHEIDFHVIVLDDAGRGIYGPPENGVSYPAETLGCETALCDRRVACVSPEWLIASHSGYALKDKDLADVRALCDRFALPLPEEHRARAASISP